MGKAQYVLGHKWLYYTVTIFVIGAMFFFFRAEIQKDTLKHTICLDDIENNLLMAEALYSSNCLAYYDEELGRTIPGTIDLSKYTAEQLDANCFKYQEQEIQISLNNTVLGDIISNKISRTRLVTIKDGETSYLAEMKFSFPESKC